MNLDLISLPIFFFVLFLFNLIGFPLTFFLFSNFEDKGYSFSRLLSILVSGYIVWILASLKVINFSQSICLIVLTSLSLLSILLLFKQKKKIIILLKQKWKIFLFEELLFWSFFVFFLLIRWLNPDLWHPFMGGEKPMDFAFLNAILRSQTFPPLDPWFSKESINYYYYGQYLVAFLIQITGIKSSIFYNIAIPFLFAQTLVNAFSLIYNISKKIFLGILASFFVGLMGNLNQIFVIIKSLSSPLLLNEWYWNATRIMPNYEINEFPFFTFLYADLHSHMIALPITILILALLFSIFGEKKSKWNFISKIFFLSLFLGTLYSTNLWDYPSFTLISLMLVFLSFLINRKFKISLVINGVFVCLIILILSNLFFLPFIINYQKGDLGIGFYQGATTPINYYLLINGFFIFVFISYFLIYFNYKIFTKISRLIALSIFIIGLIALSILKFWFLLFTFSLIVFCSISFMSVKRDRNQFFLLLLFFFAVVFTIIPDLVDFPLGLGRMNTVFKFYFQAWSLFAISSAGFLFYIFKKGVSYPKLLKYSWLLVFSLLTVMSFLYVPTASLAKTSDRMSKNAKHTLDGEEFMKTSFYSDEGKVINLKWDYDAINWINKNIKYNPVILEGNAPIYRWGGRVSVYTGFQSVIGWDWHERAHRSSLDPEIITERISDVKNIYEARDEKSFIELIRKYQINYIYLGELENNYYDRSLNFDLLKQLKKIYENNGVKIYKVID